MKKIISIILILVMCISLVSCREKEPEIVEYKGFFEQFLFDSSSAQAMIDKGYNKASELDLSVYWLEKVDQTNVKEEIQFEYMGVEYTLKYNGVSFCSNYSNCQNEDLLDDRVLDFYEYKDLNTTLEAYINRETGNAELIYSSFKGAKSGDFSIEDAQTKGEKYIKSVYGKDALDGYVVSAEYYEKTKTYAVSFRKYIDDIATEDYISISYDLKGNIYSLSALNYGQIQKVSNRITKQSIENAAAKIQEDFGENYIIKRSLFMIYLDSKTGIAYLGAVVQEKNKKTPESAIMVYVNLFN